MQPTYCACVNVATRIFWNFMCVCGCCLFCFLLLLMLVKRYSYTKPVDRWIEKMSRLGNTCPKWNKKEMKWFNENVAQCRVRAKLRRQSSHTHRYRHTKSEYMQIGTSGEMYRAFSIRVFRNTLKTRKFRLHHPFFSFLSINARKRSFRQNWKQIAAFASTGTHTTNRKRGKGFRKFAFAFYHSIHRCVRDANRMHLKSIGTDEVTLQLPYCCNQFYFIA